jgi:hypothetical protein
MGELRLHDSNMTKHVQVPHFLDSLSAHIGQEFPIHSSELGDMTVLGPDGKYYTVCTVSITNGGSIPSPGLDALYGDSPTIIMDASDHIFEYEQPLSPQNLAASQDDLLRNIRAAVLRLFLSTSIPEFSETFSGQIELRLRSGEVLGIPSRIQAGQHVPH